MTRVTPSAFPVTDAPARQSCSGTSSSAPSAPGLPCASSITALQFFTTEPLILHAEEFEGGDAPRPRATAAPHDHGRASPPSAAATRRRAAARNGRRPTAAERVAFTALANLLVGVSVSLILLGADDPQGRPDRRPERAPVGRRGIRRGRRSCPRSACRRNCPEPRRRTSSTGRSGGWRRPRPPGIGIALHRLRRTLGGEGRRARADRACRMSSARRRRRAMTSPIPGRLPASSSSPRWW